MENDLVVPPLVTQDSAEPESDPPDIEQRLTDFRSHWQQELSHQRHISDANQNKRNDSLSDSVLEQAKLLFIKGTQMEQNGNMYEAVIFYRRATQLVPDIEFRIDFSTISSPRARQESESSVGSVDNDEYINENLLLHFENLRLAEDDKTPCQPELVKTSTHISDLPIELLFLIFKWVVSTDLDMKSLENLSEVCRGFFLIAKDEEIWKLACQKEWGSNTGKCKKYGGWRNMFIQRPHVLTNGCYISKVTYYRQGEKSLDSFYKPWHEIQYHRYIRFFPEGVMIMMTSSDELSTNVTKLKSKHLDDPGLLKGVYRLSGDRVIAVLKRIKTKDQPVSYYKPKQRQEINQNEMKNTFHLEFELKDVGKKRSQKLHWLQFYIITLYKASGQQSHAHLFDSKSAHYPPLIFSPVKSYTAVSEAPLT